MPYASRILATVAFACATLTGCNGCPRGEHAPALAESDVIRLANEAARKAGYDLAKWRAPQAHFEFVDPDCTWSVFYENLGSALPSDLTIFVNDRTRSVGFGVSM